MYIQLIYLLLLLYASTIDIKKRIVYDRVHVLLFFLAICSSGDFLINILGSLFLTAPFLYLAIKTNSIGGGDIKFIFINGIMLGFSKNYFAILIGFILAYILQSILIKMKFIRKNEPLPLIPFFAIGSILVF